MYCNVTLWLGHLQLKLGLYRSIYLEFVCLTINSCFDIVFCPNNAFLDIYNVAFIVV